MFSIDFFKPFNETRLIFSNENLTFFFGSYSADNFFFKNVDASVYKSKLVIFGFFNYKYLGYLIDPL